MKRTSYLALSLCLWVLSSCSSKDRVTGEPMIVAETQDLEVRKPMAQIEKELLNFDPKLAFFESNEATLTAEAKKALLPTAQFLKQNPSVRLIVEGYCDERGSEAYNLKLGQKRADSVKRFLAEEGIPESSIDTISYGRVKGAGKKDWAQNRRTGFQLIYPKEEEKLD